MTQLKTRTSQAAALHRQAAATAVAAAATLDATQPAPADQREQHELAERLRAAAAALVPGWLGAPLGSQAADTPLGGPRLPGFVRIGTAQPLDDARFPAVVPLLGTGHLDHRRGRAGSPGRRSGPRGTAPVARRRTRRLAAGTRGRRGHRRPAVRPVRAAGRRRADAAAGDRPDRPAGHPGRGRAMGTTGPPDHRPTPPPRSHPAAGDRLTARVDRGGRPGPHRRTGPAWSRGRAAPAHRRLATTTADRGDHPATPARQHHDRVAQPVRVGR